MTTTGKSAPLGAAAARAVLRTAIGMIAREADGGPPAHMCRTDQGLRDWEEVEVRVRALMREEKAWRGKEGKDDGLKEEESALRERRIFVEALRDGYVLCQLMNKLRASSIVRPDVREAAATANLTKFLAACASYGMAREDLFSPDDFLALGVGAQTVKEKEAVARVAWTVVRLVRFVDEPDSVRASGEREHEWPWEGEREWKC
ncbi:hypothetical protein BJ912DRAFT_431025 [Pholiota molesta]|nr:hypothetical protein BJ912DRAFT_431025 [Pholiota molesta]